MFPPVIRGTLEEMLGINVVRSTDPVGSQRCKRLGSLTDPWHTHGTGGDGPVVG